MSPAASLIITGEGDTKDMFKNLATFKKTKKRKKKIQMKVIP